MYYQTCSRPHSRCRHPSLRNVGPHASLQRVINNATNYSVNASASFVPQFYNMFRILVAFVTENQFRLHVTSGLNVTTNENQMVCKQDLKLCNHIDQIQVRHSVSKVCKLNNIVISIDDKSVVLY